MTLHLGGTGRDAGDGTGRLLTRRTDGRIEVVEATFDDWTVTGQTRYQCDDLGTVEPGRGVAVAGCDPPASDDVTPSDGASEHAVCGFEAIAHDPAHLNRDARRCLLDAFADGAHAQFVSVRIDEHGNPWTEVYNTSGGEQVALYFDSRDYLGAWGRYRAECDRLQGPDSQESFIAWQSDCTPMRHADGPTEQCGAGVRIAGDRHSGEGIWSCLAAAYGRGEPAQGVAASLSPDGSGEIHLLHTGRAPPGDDGPASAIGYSIIRAAIDDAGAVEASYYSCDHLGTPRSFHEPRLDECRGPADPAFFEPLDHAVREGEPSLCGFEVLRDTSDRGDREARQCLADAFESGAAAQLVTIDLTSGDGPAARLLMAYEPGVVRVYRNAAPDVDIEICTDLDLRDGGPQGGWGLELDGCSPGD